MTIKTFRNGVNNLNTSLSKSKSYKESPWGKSASPFLSQLAFSTATGNQENKNVIILKGEMVNEAYPTYTEAM